MLDLIFNVVRDVFAWVESCPCHHRFLHHKHLSLRLRQLFLSCPLRGRRMPELSAGDFLRLIENKFEIAIGEALLLLSPSLTEEQRANLVNDFQLARAHLLFAFSLKTAALHELPLRLFVIAHHNRVVARHCLAFCMLSTGCLHPRSMLCSRSLSKVRRSSSCRELSCQNFQPCLSLLACSCSLILWSVRSKASMPESTRVISMRETTQKHMIP